MAETQTGAVGARCSTGWPGPDPPRLLVVDPRPTPVAEQAEVHLAPRPGTNLPLMNGLLHELIARGWVDQDYVAAQTVGHDELEAAVGDWTPSGRRRSAASPWPTICEAAAELLGTRERLLSTVLQGFYQSHQATAAACQVNNIHLLRGHARPARRRRAADERAANGAEHP